MRLYIDLDLLQLIAAPGNRQPITEIRAKRGTSKKLEVQFVRDGDPELLPVGTVIRFGPKQTGKYDGDFIVFTDNFTAPGDASGYYTGTASFNTTQLNTLLGSPDGNPTNDVESETLMAEFSWQTPGNDPEKTDTFDVVVANAVDNGDEAAPTEAGPTLGTRMTTAEATIAEHSLLLDGTSLVPAFKTAQLTVFSEGMAGDIRSNRTDSDTVVQILANGFGFTGTILALSNVMGQVFAVDYTGALTISGGLTANSATLQSMIVSGAVRFDGIPTTDPATTGALWNDGGTLKISA